MPASRKTQEFVKSELPYKLLMYLYNDSRAPLKRLGRQFNISYHTVAETLKKLEEKYGLTYTLELDEQRLGFSEGRIITVKFEKVPEIGYLKNRLKKDIFVQDAYLATGDFDLLLYIVGLNPNDFQAWQFNIRKDLSEYVPLFKISTLNLSATGFFPLRRELIQESTAINKMEKEVLCLLNENSRMKLKDLTAKSKSTQMRVIYAMKALQEKGIIRKFSMLTQNTDKKLLLAYSLQLFPIKQHSELLAKFVQEIIKEDLHEASNDYCLVADTNGGFDAFYICSFRNGEEMIKRGPELLGTLWAPEKPKIEKAILSGVLVGQWPLHLESYEHYRSELNAGEENR